MNGLIEKDYALNLRFTTYSATSVETKKKFTLCQLVRYFLIKNYLTRLPSTKTGNNRYHQLFLISLPRICANLVLNFFGFCITDLVFAKEMRLINQKNTTQTKSNRK